MQYIEKTTEQKILRNALVSGVINTILVSILDKEVIAPEIYSTYFSIQLVTFLSCLALLFLLKKNGFKEIYSNYLMVIYLSYSCICQFFVACSFMTFIIVLFAVSFLLTISRKSLLLISIPYTLAMILSIWFSSTSYSNAAEIDLTNKFKMDSIQTLLMTVSLILLAHSYRVKEKNKTQFLSNKLLNLGSQSLMVIHDLKGQIFPPINHSDFLLNNSKENLPIIKELNDNLIDIKNYVSEVNQLFSLKNEIKSIDIHELMKKIKVIYRSKINNVNIDVEQSDELLGDINIFKSIIANLILNSCEAFDSRGIKEKNINIKYKNNTLLFSDNAGGYSEQSLDKIQKEEFFSEKNTGSGIGIYSIKSFCFSMKAKVRFFNYKDGAATEIIFPKGIVNETT